MVTERFKSNAKKTRILHLRSSGGMLGAENVILELAKEAKNFGYECFVGAIKNIDDPDPEFVAVAKNYGLKTHIFECAGSFDLRICSKIRRYVNHHQIQILHCHGYKENVFGMISCAGLPKIATNHLWKTASLKSKFYCFIDVLVIRFFDRVVGVSDEIVQGMKTVGVRNAFKIANGIDCDRFTIKSKNMDFVKKCNLESDDFIFGMISSLSYEKNHQAALNALSANDSPNVKLLIVGGGILEEKLKKYVEEKKISKRVVFTGPLANITEALSIIDVFLIPSLNEGLPMALLEAMSSGKAVIASNVGEIDNVLEHRVNGVIIERENADELYSAMKFFLDSPAKIEKYGYKARSTVKTKFSSKTMAKKYCEVYDSMLA